MDDKEMIVMEEMVLEFEEYVNEKKDNILRELSQVYGTYDFLLKFAMVDSQTSNKITDIVEDFFKSIREEVE